MYLDIPLDEAAVVWATRALLWEGFDVSGAANDIEFVRRLLVEHVIQEQTGTGI